MAITRRTAQGIAGADSARVVAGMGLEGDVHADPLSPRQLLLASGSAYDSFSLPRHALHENLLVDFDTSLLASGTVLRIGGEVELRMMFQCEACGQLDVAQAGLAQKLGARRGMLARVLDGGLIRVGDQVDNLGPLHSAWNDDWRDRIVRVLDAVPAQSVIEYKHLARLAGVQPTYCRAFPRLISKLGPRYAGKAVSSQSASTQARWLGEDLFQCR